VVRQGHRSWVRRMNMELRLRKSVSTRLARQWGAEAAGFFAVSHLAGRFSVPGGQPTTFVEPESGIDVVVGPLGACDHRPAASPHHRKPWAELEHQI